MTYPFEHYLIVWGGSLPGGDSWSCSLRFGDSAGFIVEALGSDAQFGGAAQLDGWVGNAIKEFHARPETRISSAAKLNFIKSNQIKEDGRYKNPGSPNTRIFVDIPGASSGEPYPPNQLALAVTLTTAMSRGRGSKGRFYLPMPRVNQGTNGKLVPGMVAEVAGSCKTFIQALSDVPGLDGPPSYEVQVMSKLGTGAANTVTGVAVGDVMDTQRRRRNKLREDYSKQVVDLGAF